jgi:PPM family protein phosphatase
MAALRGGATTDVGRVRASNQDMFLTTPTIFAVADGMGGHAGGEVASRMAIELVANAAPSSINDLVLAVRQANDAIVERASTDPDLHGMGTTLCAVALFGTGDTARIVVVNVGDSRVYVVQDGQLAQVSRDHSFVEDLVEAGELTPAEARVHPRRNVLTRALGVETDVVVDTWEVQPFVGDRYLLCSDGLFNEVDDVLISEVLAAHVDPQDCADALMRRAMMAGARDNVTAVVVDVVDRVDDGPDVMHRAAPPSLANVPQSDPLVLDGVEPELGGWLASDPARPMAAAGAADLPPPAANLGSTQWQPAEYRAPERVPERATARTRGAWLTPRLVLFVGSLLVVSAVAFAAITMYARAGYTVTFLGDEVVIERGRPGGLLWYDPTIKQRTELTRAEVPDKDRDRIADGMHFGSLADAKAFLTRVSDEAKVLAGPSTATAVSSTLPVTTAPATTAPATTASPTAATTAPATTATSTATATSTTTVATTSRATSATVTTIR